MENVHISVDIGGSFIRVAAYNQSGQETGRSRTETPKLYAKGMEELKKSIKDAAQTAGIIAIGLGVPGVHNAEHTMITDSAHLPLWQDKPIVADVRAAFDCPVAMDNDVTIAALAEAEFGYGRESDFLFMIWGTGYGSTLVERKQGSLVTTAFEAGHIMSYSSQRQCGCGQVGCLEIYIGGGNLKTIYGSPADELSQEIWQHIAQLAGLGLANVMMIRPTIKLVVYSGGTIQKQPALVDLIDKYVRRRMTIYEPPKIVLSKLGEDTGLLGGLVLARKAGG